jgi:hypothetical protein
MQSMQRMKQETSVRCRPIECGGLRYLWRPESFLAKAEAEYAIAQLWRLSAGSAAWNADAAIDIPAIDAQSVARFHELAAGALDWVSLDDLLPPGAAASLDTNRLPALCQASSGYQFGGSGPFPMDLVAATFLMLSRWEELHHAGPLDCHCRTRAKYTLAHRQGFLDRPVIDEWALVLRCWLQHLAAGWHAQPPRPTIIVTHDVDRMQRFPNPWRVLRASGAELVLRSRSPLATFHRFAEGVKGFLSPAADSYYQAICRQMDFCESLSVRGTFNLMTARKGEYDEGYNLALAPCREMFDEIQKRGHRVGWHPGYRAAADSSIFTGEKARMDQIMGATRYGGRHHYLRWSVGKSWEQWEDLGLLYDSSLGYPDEIGFRCGTSHPFPCFSLPRQRQLSLVEEPLIIMDCALQNVVERQGKSAYSMALEILSRARTAGGSPAVLYHNSYRYASPNAAVSEDSLLAAVQCVLE